jgi:hypothetical protein
MLAHLRRVRSCVAGGRTHSAVAEEGLLSNDHVDVRTKLGEHRRTGHAAMTASTPAESGYQPSGMNQIIQDESRLRRGTAGDFGMHWGLFAVGNQLKAESDLVEDAIQLIVAHEDKQVVASAASLLATILLEGVPRDQLRSPIRFPVSFSLPDDVDGEDRLAWQENVKVASAVVSAYAARDPDAIAEAASILCGGGAFEVLAVLVAAAARKLERHATWFSEALRCTETPTTGPPTSKPLADQ